MIIDFTEISDSHEFENFAMQLLIYQSNKVISIPAIGPDGGKDFICEEPSRYTAGTRWLVSCKHYAHSGRTVGVADDKADVNKLIQHNCHCFMFMYSTPISEPLRSSIEQVCNNSTGNPKAWFFTPTEIQNIILSDPHFYPLLQQYFPASHQRLMGCFNTNPVCCSNGSCSSNNIYAVYTKDSTTRMITPTVIGDCCFASYIEHLESNNVPYSYTTIRHAP